MAFGAAAVWVAHLALSVGAHVGLAGEFAEDGVLQEFVLVEGGEHVQVEAAHNGIGDYIIEWDH